MFVKIGLGGPTFVKIELSGPTEGGQIHIYRGKYLIRANMTQVRDVAHGPLK
jgi:hypothetical protein